MWNTPQGKRSLQGAEARVFRETVAELVDAIRAERESDIHAEYGIPVFDKLLWQEKLAMLLHVARPLLDASVPEPTKTALRDATVGAVYAQMVNGVEIEIDAQQSSDTSHDGDTQRRVEIAAALNEQVPHETWPDAESIVVEEWKLGVEVLQNLVLDDEDWQFAELTLDADPEDASRFREALGIDKDYAIAIPPDVNACPPEVVWADLVELVSGSRPDESVFLR